MRNRVRILGIFQIGLRTSDGMDAGASSCPGTIYGSSGPSYIIASLFIGGDPAVWETLDSPALYAARASASSPLNVSSRNLR